MSGSIPAFAGGVSGTFSWSGTVSLVLDHLGPAPNGSPPGQYAFFRPDGGTVHLALDMVDGHCTGHGETDIAVDPSSGLSSVQQGVPQPTYTLYAAFGASPGIAFAWTGGTPADPCANDGTLPFDAGLPVLGHPDAPVAVDHTGREHHRQLPRAHGQRPPSVVARAAGLTRVDTVSTARAPW